MRQVQVDPFLKIDVTYHSGLCMGVLEPKIGTWYVRTMHEHQDRNLERSNHA